MSTSLHEQQELAATRYKNRAPKREETERQQEATGTLVVDEPDQIQARAERLLGDAVGVRAVRQAARTEGALERIIAGNDLQPSLFLGRGTAIAESVGRISLADGGAGTGFLVGRRLLLTNNHVLPDAATAADAFVEFDFELGPDGRPEMPAAFSLDPDTLFLTDAEVDASLVAVAPASGVVAGDKYGWNKLVKQQGKIVIGEAANVIGHPSGRRKEIAVRNNHLLDQLDLFLHYEADTEPGNSGSPVFNDQWEVVALHHSGVPRTDDAGQWLTVDGAVWDRSMGDAAVAWVANEGARISVVLTRLRALARTPAQIALVGELGAEAVGTVPTEVGVRVARSAREDTGRRGLRGIPETPPHLVFLHGRAQQNRDPAELRLAWAGGLTRGLGAAGLPPLDPARAWFPYYGDRLAQLAGPSAVELAGANEDAATTAAEQGAPPGSSARATYAALIEDAAARAGFRPDTPADEGLSDLLGPVQAALSHLAASSRLDDLFIALRFRDVALYLDDDQVRSQVLDTVLATFPTSGPVTLVSHSLGTVVALDLLTRVPPQVDLRLLVTAGSPVGLDSVNKRLLTGGPVRPDVERWVNAWCVADAVTIGCPLAPTWGNGVEDVRTDNPLTMAHSIAEYLADLRVASAIGNAV